MHYDRVQTKGYSGIVKMIDMLESPFGGITCGPGISSRAIERNYEGTILIASDCDVTLHYSPRMSSPFCHHKKADNERVNENKTKIEIANFFTPARTCRPGLGGPDVEDDNEGGGGATDDGGGGCIAKMPLSAEPDERDDIGRIVDDDKLLRPYYRAFLVILANRDHNLIDDPPKSFSQIALAIRKANVETEARTSGMINSFGCASRTFYDSGPFHG
ncbi:hypothetical protein TELCIR_04828, partial [Teladorsagia circumcincta]